MPEREVSKSQQSFHGPTEASEFSFAFYKVYKRQPKNRFRVRVIQLADLSPAVSAQPHIYFASGLVNSGGIYSEVTGGVGNGMVSNDFVLGITPRNFYDIVTHTDTSGLVAIAPCEFYTDDVSTSPFIVKYRHVSTAEIATGNVSVVVVFEITELEEY